VVYIPQALRKKGKMGAERRDARWAQNSVKATRPSKPACAEGHWLNFRKGEEGKGKSGRGRSVGKKNDLGGVNPAAQKYYEGDFSFPIQQ